MATIKPTDGVRQQIVEMVTKLMVQEDFEVLRVASQKLAIPVLDDNQNETYVTITVAVPSGTRGGEPYDGHAEAQDFEMRQARKAAAKIAADKDAAKHRKAKAAQSKAAQ